MPPWGGGRHAAQNALPLPVVNVVNVSYALSPGPGPMVGRKVENSVQTSRIPGYSGLFLKWESPALSALRLRKGENVAQSGWHSAGITVRIVLTRVCEKVRDRGQEPREGEGLRVNVSYGPPRWWTIKVINVRKVPAMGPGAGCERGMCTTVNRHTLVSTVTVMC